MVILTLSLLCSPNSLGPEYEVNGQSNTMTPSDSNVSYSDMNPMSLFLLGRRLMQIAEGALPGGRKGTSLRLVFVDIAYHPNSSITEITTRTGFPQSLVSTAVARLRDRGVVESEPDPLDRRRTLVRASAAVKGINDRLAQISIDDLVAQELSNEGEGELDDVIAAINLLSRLLTPEVRANDDETSLPRTPGFVSATSQTSTND